MRKPKLGQVFLIDQNIINKIIQVAALAKSQHVLEIGCGDGILTEALAQKVSQLTVVEIDENCLVKTQQRCKQFKHIHWVHSDVLALDLDRFDQPVTVVANVPYYLSAKLIQWFALNKHKFNLIIIMIQKEFAQKCLVGPGVKAYTSLSVFTQRHFKVKKLFDITRTCFKPVPNVDSTMIRLEPYQFDLPLEDELFDRIVTACFWGKRKKLATALNKNPFVKFNQDVRNCDPLQDLLTKRADQLSLKDYVFVAQQLQHLGFIA